MPVNAVRSYNTFLREIRLIEKKKIKGIIIEADLVKIVELDHMFEDEVILEMIKTSQLSSINDIDEIKRFKLQYLHIRDNLKDIEIDIQEIREGKAKRLNERFDELLEADLVKSNEVVNLLVDTLKELERLENIVKKFEKEVFKL